MSWHNQHNDEASKVQVSGDYARNEERTDFLFIDKASGEYAHYSIGSEPGSELIPRHDYR